MAMEKIRSGQSFLYRENGYDSTVVEVRMTDKVTGSYLQAALTDAVARFPYLTDKLVEKNGNYYLCPDYNSMVLNKTEKYRTLGSMATGYHLLDVTYTGNRIRVAFHHGLCDGKGVKPFVETLLYYYCRRKYRKDYSGEGIRLLGENIDPAETAEPFSTAYFDSAHAASDVEKDGFSLPESTGNPEICCRKEFLVEEADFVANAKAVGATPAIFAAMLLSESIFTLHPTADKPIVCNMAMDMRGALGMEKTHRNCVASAYLPYGEKESHAMEKTALAQEYRRLLKEQRTPEAVKAGLNQQIGLFNKLDEKQTLEEKREMMSFFNSMVNNTYILSYLGKLRLNDFAGYIESAHFYHDRICGLVVNMLSAGGKMSFEMLQGFTGMQYAAAFEKELKNCGLKVKTEGMSAVNTGKDRAWITASRQAERFYREPCRHEKRNGMA